MAGATWSFSTTFVAGNVLTAAQLNTLQSDVTTNFTPAGMDDESANTAAMQATADPYPASSESLPTDLTGELQRIRFLLKQISGEAQWYIDPDNSLLSTSSPTYAGLTLNGGATIGGNITGALSIRDKSRDLIIGGVTNTTVDIDASELIVQDANGYAKRLSSINLTLTITNVWTADSATKDGLGFGLTEANSTWYYLWVVSGTTGDAGVLTTESTLAGALADVGTGYNTYGALVGMVYNDGSGNLVPITQWGNHVEYDALQIIKSGSFTVSSWTAQSVTAFFPPTAKRATYNFGNGEYRGLSPRSDGHAGSYVTAATAAGGGQTYGGIVTAASTHSMHNIRYAANIYYFTEQALSYLYAVGWEY